MPDKVITLDNLSTFKDKLDEILATKQDLINDHNPINADYIDDTNATNKFVTANDKTNWNDKPEVIAYQSTTPLTAAQIAKAAEGKLAIYNNGKLYIESFKNNAIINFSHFTTGHDISSSQNVNDILVTKEYKIILDLETGLLSDTGYMPVDAIGDYANNYLDSTAAPSSSGKKLIRERNLSKTQDMIANEYNSTSTYAVGDYVIYQNNLYKCTTAITIAEAWTAAHWTATDLTSEIDNCLVQNTLTAGKGININGNTIAVTGVTYYDYTNTAQTNPLKFVKLTQSQYTGLATVDDDTFYIIIPDPAS